jgi:flagellar hook-length control protein FliK
VPGIPNSDPVAPNPPGAQLDSEQAPTPPIPDQATIETRAAVQNTTVQNPPQLQSATVAAAVQAVTGTGPTTGISLIRQRNQTAKETNTAAVDAASITTGASSATAPVSTPATAQAGAPMTPAAPLPQQPVIDQVIHHLTKQHLITSRNLRDGTHQAIIHLNPDNLGQVTVTMDVRAGEVRLDLAAGQQALSTLGNDLGQLRSQFAGAGLNLTDVTLSAQTADSGAGQPAPRRDAPPASPSRNSPSDGPMIDSGTRLQDPASGQGRPAAPGSLDLLV